ncbi:LOW QUALITY PROTEIN: solute carrier family 12 member 9 [Ornithorhynchus anatinus]|uniref:LOW QUALITY PROTEIN: solute carrier family 12 member 9 n=1 Tax=Ornithorhynchus anatinus TaxID=9258 RepID=UPI0010A93B84|nr:LOW QUALITY PROTEIN: solute carrier family 12 member 9 [Ornithorhynchus anatinus]
MFYLANVCGCAVYVLGLVEAVLDVFGTDAGVPSGVRVLPQGYGWSLLYGTLLLGLVGGVCTLGAGLYARAAFLTFLLVSGSLASVLVSFVAVGPRDVPLPPRPGPNGSSGPPQHGRFTGFNTSTLRDNLYAGYAQDYTTGVNMTFASVFAVLFNGCTGIMAGANMSGELKDPSRAIPLGTIIAVVYTFFVYALLFFLSSFTCNRTLLQEDYGFFRAISLWPPLVLVGVYATSLSASMSSLIGASRILHALARDDLFGLVLAPAKVVTQGGNPWGAVLYSWALVQVVLLVGKLNTLAAVVTVFYLVAYAAVDLSCLSLEWASAPNFRPTFGLFSWHTCLLGVASCLLMMFLISPGAAGASLLLMALLSGLLTARGGPTSWGYVSQALLFHQVRKYLLRLDVRKEHVKFWRPQLLLLVGNPRGALPLLRLANQLKKGGLYVLGHVTLGDLDSLPSDPVQPQYEAWLGLVDRAQVKAFVDLTLSPSVRHGAQHLLRISGLGGMKPNTLVLGFYDETLPQDHFLSDPAFSEPAGAPSPFPPPREAGSPTPHPQDYVAMVADALKMNKNVVLARGAGGLPPERLGMAAGAGAGPGPLPPPHHLDIWPLNLLRPRGGPGYVDVCGLFVLQMATILGMVPAWRGARLRIFLCPGPREPAGAGEGRLRALLEQLRIRAEVREVAWEGSGDGGDGEEGDFVNGHRGEAEAEALAVGANALVRAQQGGGPAGGGSTALTFLYLPRPPADAARYPSYLALLERLSRGLGPALLVHGLTPVTCTDL